MQIARDIAGLLDGRGRRAAQGHVGKKQKDKIPIYREQFVAGARRATASTPKLAARHLRVHRAVRGLGFPKGHAVGVRLDRLSDRVSQGELSARVPRRADDVGARQDRQARRVPRGGAQGSASACCRPTSTSRWSTLPSSEPTIRFGLAAVKGVGEGAVRAMLAARDADGPFADLFDFARRVERTLDQPQGARGADQVRRAATASAATARNCSTRSIRRSRSRARVVARTRSRSGSLFGEPGDHEELRPQLRDAARAADARSARRGRRRRSGSSSRVIRSPTWRTALARTGATPVKELRERGEDEFVTRRGHGHGRAPHDDQGAAADAVRDDRRHERAASS